MHLWWLSFLISLCGQSQQPPIPVHPFKGLSLLPLGDVCVSFLPQWSPRSHWSCTFIPLLNPVTHLIQFQDSLTHTTAMANKTSGFPCNPSFTFPPPSPHTNREKFNSKSVIVRNMMQVKYEHYSKIISSLILICKGIKQPKWTTVCVCWREAGTEIHCNNLLALLTVTES